MKRKKYIRHKRQLKSAKAACRNSIRIHFKKENAFDHRNSHKSNSDAINYHSVGISRVSESESFATRWAACCARVLALRSLM